MARFTMFLVAMFLLLLLSPPARITSGSNTMFYGVAATRPLEEKGEEYVMYKPKTSGTNKGQGINGCLPKGLRHSSGPSRYINYQTLGSTGVCSTVAPKP
ncbi:hypothetical protein SSX86_017957 [Deinandra increscens subsp. villosa]|uniref:Uncharacterized protein n=1 Tax=Deinandra increscens subsp. villosa TaxID=3103831 RepID=A0AAP0D0V4_9ASTR